MDNDVKKVWRETLAASENQKPGATYRGKTHPYFAENNMCLDIPVFRIYRKREKEMLVDSSITKTITSSEDCTKTITDPEKITNTITDPQMLLDSNSQQLIKNSSLDREFSDTIVDPTQIKSQEAEQKKIINTNYQKDLKDKRELDTLDIKNIFENYNSDVSESDYDQVQSPAYSSYKIDSELARGGMGVVFKAWQNSLKRQVAIKQILPHSWKPSIQEKFIAEATVTAYLGHPNIPSVYDLGQSEEGDIAMTMQLVDGYSWVSLLYPENTDEMKQAQKYTEEDHIRILLNICNGIAFAHSKGIAHNDLKPENIMIGEFQEVYIMDWGIAVDFLNNREDDLPIVKKANVTKPMGTPSYMPVELATGNGMDIGPWTDVYLIGGLLYEIIERVPPRTGETALDVLDDAIEGTIPIFTKAVPCELRQICLKALSRDIKNRYQSVNELQDDIRNYLLHRQSLLISNSSEKILKDGIVNASMYSKDEEDHIRCYENLSKAVSGFEQALLLWKNNKNAQLGKKNARIKYAKVALENGDILLAESQISEINQSTPEAQNLHLEIQAAKEKRKRAKKMMGRLKWGIVVAIVIIICGLVTVHLSLREKEKKMALQYSSLFIESLTKSRNAYSIIVNKVKKYGVEVGYDHEKSDQIPFPATYSIDLAKQISKNKNGIKARLYSNFPFPWRKDGGVHDDFGKVALKKIEKTPNEAYFEIEKRDNGSFLRYAKGVILKAGCIGCHNTHPESPKTDWKIGDVRGIQEVTIPLGSTIDEVKKLAFRIFLPITILMLLVIFMINVIISRRNDNKT